MENTGAFVCGLLALILAIVDIFIPTYNLSILVSLLMLGIVIAINAGILLLLGGIWSSKNLGGAGFGTGMGGWGLIIGISIYGIMWNQQRLAMAAVQDAVALIISIIFMDPFYYIMFAPYTTSYRIGLTGSIVDLCLMLGAMILGIISFSLDASKGI